MAAAISTWRDYVALCKPKIVCLIVFTALVGMLMATPGPVALSLLVPATLGIGLAAASAAAVNHVVDRKVDALMARTHKRPLPKGDLSARNAICFAAVLCVIAMAILVLRVNMLTALLTFISLIGYGVIYSMFLKRATPQNIVIGGAAGAAPPVLGWTAVSGSLEPHALLLFLIIFAWTPPHFWALAIARRKDYENAAIPMLPVTHGLEFTRLHILLYTLLLFIVTLLPYLTGMSGITYLSGALALGGGFLYFTVKLMRRPEEATAMSTFSYSIWYLMGLFAVLLVDHYIPALAQLVL
ncbi:MAG: heme o synthase [Gammaproteobacteria bacterium]|nr:heme o synthase [Gammaproteobacteria bacterium]